MKLSLKAARKLESAIKNLTAQGLDSSVKVRIQDEWKNIVEMLGAGGADLSEKISDLESLVKVQYTIRREIELANEKNKLNELMNRKSRLSAEIQLAKAIGSNGEVSSLAELKDAVEYQKESLKKERSSYGSDNAVTKRLSVLTEDMVNSAQKKVLEKTKEVKKIEDELSELNHSVKISLSEESVSLLEKYNLV